MVANFGAAGVVGLIAYAVIFETLVILAYFKNAQLADRFVIALMFDEAITGNPVVYDADKELSAINCDCSCVDLVAVSDVIDTNDELN
jgi:hypothetical protein